MIKEKQGISLFDLRVCEILNHVQLDKERSLLAIKIGKGTIKALIEHPSDANIHALTGKLGIAALNVSHKSYWFQSKMHKCKGHIIYKCERNEIIIPVPPVGAVVGDQVHSSDDSAHANLSDIFDTQTNQSFEKFVEDLNMDSDVTYDNKKLIIENKGAVESLKISLF